MRRAAVSCIALCMGLHLLLLASAQVPTLHVDSSLTLIDILAESTDPAASRRQLLTGLTRNDFRLYDNGHPVTIQTFDAAGASALRPIALWLIVQCPDDQPAAKHSTFLRGSTRYLAPALQTLSTDETLGVAHWCDNGEAALDLPLGHNIPAALQTIEKILSAPPTRANVRPGELVLQTLLRMILSAAGQTAPRRLPVLVFLHGDGLATSPREAHQIEDGLLQTSSIVFGLNNGRWPVRQDLLRPPIADRRTFYLIHTYAQATGGEVYSVADPANYSQALRYILEQTRSRYTLGFQPTNLDGRRHHLTAELTPEATQRHPRATLRFRSEYIPLPAPAK